MKSLKQLLEIQNCESREIDWQQEALPTHFNFAFCKMRILSCFSASPGWLDYSLMTRICTVCFYTSLEYVTF